MKTATKPRAPRAAKMGLQPSASASSMTAPVVQPLQPATSAGFQLLQAAINRGVSTEELDRMIALMERMEANDARKAFVAAMVDFKKKAPTITTNQTGEVRKDNKVVYTYGYADLAEVNEKIIAALADVDISHDWTQHQEGGQLYVTCTLTHVLGHSKSTVLGASPDNSGGKTGPQALGSSNTYLERYTLLAVCGLAVRDGSDNDAQPSEAERAEMQGAAREMRQPRPNADQMAAQRQSAVEPAPASLLDDAGTASDGGRESFGTFWKSLNGVKRTQLGPHLANFEARATKADSQRTKGGK